MISKRVLLIMVCLAVLIVAVGVYAYNSMNNASNMNTFVFEWSSEEQTEVDGTLRMELTFAIKGENLSVLAKINDKNSSYSKLLIVFDMNQSGAIEVGEPCYVFYYNEYRSPSRTNNAWWDGRGAFSFACGPQYPSPYHTRISDETGVTFIISIPLEELDLVNDLVIMSYLGESGAFWKEFNFGLEV